MSHKILVSDPISEDGLQSILNIQNLTIYKQIYLKMI